MSNKDKDRIIRCYHKTFTCTYSQADIQGLLCPFPFICTKTSQVTWHNYCAPLFKLLMPLCTLLVPFHYIVCEPSSSELLAKQASFITTMQRFFYIFYCILELNSLLGIFLLYLVVYLLGWGSVVHCFIKFYIKIYSLMHMKNALIVFRVYVNVLIKSIYCTTTL